MIDVILAHRLIKNRSIWRVSSFYNKASNVLVSTVAKIFRLMDYFIQLTIKVVATSLAHNTPLVGVYPP